MDISGTILATTIFIFFLLPGFIFLRAFWGSQRGPLSSNNFYNYLMWGTLASVITYAICLFLFNKVSSCMGYTAIDIAEICKSSVLGLSIAANGRENTAAGNIDFILPEIYKVIFFCLLSDCFALTMGRMLRWGILKTKLDLKIRILRFSNDWFYSLSGRGYAAKGDPLYPNGFYVEVDFLCEVGDSVVIYKGVMFDYKLKDEALEYIYIKAVRRTGITQWETAYHSLNNITLPSFSSQAASIISGGSIIVTGSIKNDGAIEAKDAIDVTGGLIETNGSIRAGKEIKAKDVIVKGAAPVPPPAAPITASTSAASLQAINMNPVFYRLSKDLMVFKVSEIKNMNISYMPFPNI